jgi:hypothetical protein
MSFSLQVEIPARLKLPAGLKISTRGCMTGLKIVMQSTGNFIYQVKKQRLSGFISVCSIFKCNHSLAEVK